MRGKCIGGLALLLMVAAANTGAGVPPGYATTDLGTLGGAWSEAYAINNSRQVVGVAKNASGEERAFRWTQNGMLGIPFNPQMEELTSIASRSAAFGVNDNGYVVGYMFSPYADSEEATFWTDAGDLRCIGRLPGNNNRSWGYGINDAGQCVGRSSHSNYMSAFLLPSADEATRGYNADLIALAGGYSGAGRAINTQGCIAGSNTAAASQQRAVLWTADENGQFQMRDLGTLAGGQSQAFAINDLCQIVGVSDNRAFLWTADGTDGPASNPQMMEIGTLGGSASRALGINASGQVVGVASVATTESHAFIWDDGIMYDLNDLIPADSGWLLSSAYDINDAGWVVGSGINPMGQRRAFLLVPEPATLALLAVGGVGALLRGRRHGKR